MKFFSLAAASLLAASIVASPAMADPENTLVIQLKDGEVEIALRPDIAPQHVEQIKTLARQGEYDNVAFHRVIEGFMAQTGDVQFGNLERGYNSQRVGTGGSSLGNVPAEFSGVPFERGTMGMARSQDPNSANSQFFICFEDAPWLNRQYSVWGQVVEGMENVDQIKRGEPVRDPDSIVTMRVAADA